MSLPRRAEPRESGLTNALPLQRQEITNDRSGRDDGSLDGACRPMPDATCRRLLPAQPVTNHEANSLHQTHHNSGYLVTARREFNPIALFHHHADACDW